MPRSTLSQTHARAELLTLLELPPVAAGFAGAAGRYREHLEAGARLGAASLLTWHWRGSLASVTRQLAMPQRPKALEPEERRTLELLHRYALRLQAGEIVAPPQRRVRDTDLPLDPHELADWAKRHDLGAVLELDVWSIGIRTVHGKVLDVAAPSPRVRTLPMEAMETRALLTREARIALPPAPAHERPPPPAALATYAALLDAHRARLTFTGTPTRQRFSRVMLDVRKDPPVIQVEYGHRSIGITVVPAEQELRTHIPGKAPPDDLVGSAFDVALDLLSWPTKDELEVLTRALTPRWTELLRALEQAPVQSAAPSAVATGEERIAYRLTRHHSIEVVLQKRAKPGKRGKLPAGASADGWSPGRTLFLSKLPPGLPQEELSIIARLSRAWGTAADATTDNLRVLVGHPRVYNADGAHIVIGERVARLSVEDAGGVSRVGVRVGDEACSRELLRALLARGGSVLDERVPGRLDIVTLPPALHSTARAIVDVGGDIPAEGRDALLSVLARFEGASTEFIELDDGLLGTRLEPELQVIARLAPDTSPTGERLLALALGVRALPRATPFSPDAGPDRIAIVDDGKRVFCLRDRARERAACDALRAALPLDGATPTEDLVWRLDTVDKTLEVVRALHAQAAAGAVVVEWPQGRAWRVAEAGLGALKVEVAGGSPLSLHVQGEVQVDGARIALMRLLDAARSGRRYIQLSDDRFVTLSSELRERACALDDAGLADVAGDGAMTGSVGLAVALEELEAAGAVVQGSKLWSTWRERLQTAAAVDDRVPRGLDGELRPYQREGLRFLRRLVALGTGGILADDMGLGKTLQATALLVERAPLGPALVVAPTSVCFNWARELSRFAPGLRAQVLHEVDDRAEALMKLKKRDVLVASYGLVLREAELFEKRRFATLILDEAQAIKNASAQRAKAVRALQADARIALTGTPIENHTGELWSIFAAVAPGLLPPLDDFRTRFQIPVERGRNPERRRALARLVRPFLLRRTKAEVAPELPARTEIVTRVELSPDERQHYDALRRVLAEKLRATELAPVQRRVMILSALARLRQVACHPALDVTGDAFHDTPSSKLKQLLRLLSGLKDNGHRALVFSQFTRLLDLIEPQLRAAAISFVRLDGSTEQRARARAVDAFQAGEADVFLLSLKAGGFGLNLTAADYVIHVDPWWNPAAEAQATDRAHRIGQTRPVTVYRLVASGTLEEGVLAMQAEKRALFSGVLEDGAAGAMDESDLLALLEDASAARSSAENAAADAD